MTTFLLIRHALCDHVGLSLAGRAPGVSLNAAGREQAAALAQRLAGVALDAVYSSPIERARETAAAIAEGRQLSVSIAEELTELDFAGWTGRDFQELQSCPQWRRFNHLRSMTRASSGELMLEVQSRAVTLIARLCATWPTGRVVLVSHCDVLRGLIAHAAGIPLDLFQRIQVDPASVSVLRVEEHGLSLQCLNVTECLPL